MSKFIQIRGISGAGKSTITKRLVIDQGGPRKPTEICRIDGKNFELRECRGGLWVMGSYDLHDPIVRTTGGDGLKKLSTVHEFYEACTAAGHPFVVWESKLASTSKEQPEDRFDPSISWAVLDTPLKTCSANVLKRQQEKGEPPKLVKEEAAARAFKYLHRYAKERLDRGRPVILLQHTPFEHGYNHLLDLLYYNGWRGEERSNDWAAWEAVVPRATDSTPLSGTS